jgi:hypothetical protein
MPRFGRPSSSPRGFSVRVTVATLVQRRNDSLAVKHQHKRRAPRSLDKLTVSACRGFIGSNEWGFVAVVGGVGPHTHEPTATAATQPVFAETSIRVWSILHYVCDLLPSRCVLGEQIKDSYVKSHGSPSHVGVCVT